MLKIVRCEIISMTRNDTIDAYVLRYELEPTFRNVFLLIIKLLYL